MTPGGVPDAAFAAALFQPMGADGVYARTGLFVHVMERLDALISTLRPAGAEILRFPPVMSRADLEKSGYLGSFPNLLGCVCALHGTPTEIEAVVRAGDGSWTGALRPADLVLAPAACYPVYPLAASRDKAPTGGAFFDVACDCFRREPSKMLDRLQSFRMREYVCIGAAADVIGFREAWIASGQALAASLGLAAKIAPANDPFFGREGRVKAVSQLQQALKFELLVPIYGADKPTACMSFNIHRDHFGTVWGLRDAEGGVAHTGCAAFGMDRLTLALLWTHGTTLSAWPSEVRDRLGL